MRFPVQAKAEVETSIVGLGLTVAGLVGLTASVPLGGLADRYDPRTLRAVLQLLQAAVAASGAVTASQFGRARHHLSSRAAFCFSFAARNASIVVRAVARLPRASALVPVTLLAGAFAGAAGSLRARRASRPAMIALPLTSSPGPAST